MKSHGCIMEHTAQRNAELFRVFSDRFSRCTRIVIPEFYEAIANTPCSRFWVSEERAAIIIARLEKGKSVNGLRSLKREMYEEIYRRYKILRAHRPHASLGSLVAEVVHQPAPKFYLAPGSVQQMFYKHKRLCKRLRTRIAATCCTNDKLF